MLGEDNDAEIDSEERSRSFSHKAAWQRFLVVFAGPFFNLFFAVLLYFGLFALVGVPQVEPAEGGLVGQVLAGSPAERAGIRAGDLIRRPRRPEAGGRRETLRKDDLRGPGRKEP